MLFFRERGDEVLPRFNIPNMIFVQGVGIIRFVVQNRPNGRRLDYIWDGPSKAIQTLQVTYDERALTLLRNAKHVRRKPLK